MVPGPRRVINGNEGSRRSECVERAITSRDETEGDYQKNAGPRARATAPHTRSIRAATDLCQGVPTKRSRSLACVSSLGAMPIPSASG